MNVVTINPAEMLHRYRLELAGAACEVATNSQDLGSSLATWRAGDSGDGTNTFTMQVLVNSAIEHQPAHPHFRGLHHIVVASFGTANVFVFDLLRRNVVASVSKTIARDRRFWDDLLLPIAMGILGAAVGVIPVHCACLTVGDEGLLVAGASGAGKSILSLALAQHKFGFISDDWTYLSLRRETLVAHGLSVPIKLLPDAVEYFPSLADYSLQIALNQELAYEVPPDKLGADVRLSCIPRWFFFLERTATPGCRFDAIPPCEAHQYIHSGVEPLPAQLKEVQERRSDVIDRISQMSCWRFRYGGSPALAAREIREFTSQPAPVVSA